MSELHWAGVGTGDLRVGTVQFAQKRRFKSGSQIPSTSAGPPAPQHSHSWQVDVERDARQNGFLSSGQRVTTMLERRPWPPRFVGSTLSLAAS